MVSTFLAKGPADTSLWDAIWGFAINNPYQKSVLIHKLFQERNQWLGHHQERVSKDAVGKRWAGHVESVRGM